MVGQFVILLSNSRRYTRADVVNLLNEKLTFLAFANIVTLSLKTQFNCSSSERDSVETRTQIF